MLAEIAAGSLVIFLSETSLLEKRMSKLLVQGDDLNLSFHLKDLVEQILLG